jgi:hypothetical protein
MKFVSDLQQVGGFLQAFQFSPPKKKPDPCRPCFLSNRDEMGNIYRESSIDASYKVSVHLAKRFQRRILLEINQPETRIAYSGHVCKQIRTK